MARLVTLRRYLTVRLLYRPLTAAYIYLPRNAPSKSVEPGGLLGLLTFLLFQASQQGKARTFLTKQMSDPKTIDEAIAATETQAVA